jgi:hypothetical protein
VAGDGRNGRRINSRCVHAAAGRDRHGRFERGRREWEENEHLKLEKVDVPEVVGHLKIGALVQALDGTKVPYDGRCARSGFESSIQLGSQCHWTSPRSCFHPSYHRTAARATPRIVCISFPHGASRSLLVHRVTALLRPPAPAWDDGIQEGIVAAASHFVCILRHIGPSGRSKRARGSSRCSAVSRGFSLARKPLVVGRHSETPASQRCAERSLLRRPRGIAAHLCCTHTSSVCTRDKKHIYCCCNAAAHHTLSIEAWSPCRSCIKARHVTRRRWIWGGRA